MSLFTEDTPSTCRPTTSKTVSSLRNCPGTIAATRVLRDEGVAGQPIQSFTGISVSMRQLSLCASSFLLSSRRQEQHDSGRQRLSESDVFSRRGTTFQSNMGFLFFTQCLLQSRCNIVAMSVEQGTIVVPRQLPISHEFSSLRLLMRT